MENTLSKSAFLVGKHVSVADIMLATLYTPLLRFCLGEAFQKQFPNTLQWFMLLTESEPFLKYLGRRHLCNKPLCPTMFRPIVHIWSRGQLNTRVAAIQALCDLVYLKSAVYSVASWDDLKTPEFLRLNPLGQIPTI